MLLANATLELQRWRHLALFLAEVAREESEPLDLLRPGKLSVYVVDNSLNDAGQLVGRDEIFDCTVESVCASKTPGLFDIEGQQRNDVRPSVANDQRL